MSHAAHLWLFFVVVFAVVVLPGLDMAFVLASSLVGGRRKGLIAVAGIVAGGICHVTVGALGLAVLLKVVPGAFNALLIAGASYIAWIGVSLVRSRESATAAANHEALSPAATFRRAALTNLLNPKAYLFMLAIFPQFIAPAYGPIWLQAIVLGVIIAVTQVAVYGAIAFVAGGAREWLATRPRAMLGLARTVGAVLIVAAVVTGVQGWRGL
jgi:threonine/homoserine/homoserine lactone efflux protein